MRADLQAPQFRASQRRLLFQGYAVDQLLIGERYGHDSVFRMHELGDVLLHARALRAVANAHRLGDILRRAFADIGPMGVRAFVITGFVDVRHFFDLLAGRKSHVRRDQSRAGQHEISGFE